MKPFGTTTMEDRMYAMSDEGLTMSAVAQGSRQRARVIRNPSSGGGSCDPDRLREQLSGFELDWIETIGPGDALARDFDAREVKLTLDGEERTVCAANVAIGNCRYAGGGWLAAPRANPEDGLLDVVVVEKPGIGEALALAPAMLSGSDYLDERGVFFARAKEILAETVPPGLEFTVDGEVIGDEPAEFAVVPRALKVMVGPGYQAESSGADEGDLRGG